MNAGLQTIHDFLEEHGYECSLDEKSGVLLTQINNLFSYVCIARTNEADSIFRFYAVMEETVPPDRATALAELCVRASLLTEVGSFVFDADNGAASFRISTLYLPGTLDAEIVKEVVVYSIKAADRFYPAFLLLLQENDFEVALKLYKSSSEIIK